MNINLGYTKPLFILAFDHRSSFVKNLLGIENRELSQDENEKITQAKRIVYEGFKRAINDGVPNESAAILVDEQFGSDILLDAKNSGYTIALTVEKSGQEEFDFEYGNEFPSHIEKYKPDFVKALVRYNPGDNIEKNLIQLKRLSLLGEFCHKNGYKFLVELLVLPLQNETSDSFDTQARPGLTLRAIIDFQNNTVEPDVWKIEGMVSSDNYTRLAEQTRSNGRGNVRLVVLGRGEDKNQVEQWLKAAKHVEGVIGFAIGRTIFMTPLISYRDEKINREQAVEEIAKNYKYFYSIFTDNR